MACHRLPRLPIACMVIKMSSSECTHLLKALADETRWRIVQHLLSCDRAKVTALATELKTPQPSISKHLRILRNAGIVAAAKDGTSVWCSIAPEFRQQLIGGGAALDLGCCTFRFEDCTCGPRGESEGEGATCEATAS